MSSVRRAWSLDVTLSIRGPHQRRLQGSLERWDSRHAKGLTSKSCSRLTSDCLFLGRILVGQVGGLLVFQIGLQFRPAQMLGSLSPACTGCEWTPTHTHIHGLKWHVFCYPRTEKDRHNTVCDALWLWIGTLTKEHGIMQSGRKKNMIWLLWEQYGSAGWLGGEGGVGRGTKETVNMPAAKKHFSGFSLLFSLLSFSCTPPCPLWAWFKLIPMYSSTTCIHEYDFLTLYQCIPWIPFYRVSMFDPTALWSFLH